MIWLNSMIQCSIGIDIENLAQSAILKLSRLSFMSIFTKFLFETELSYWVMLPPPILFHRASLVLFYILKAYLLKNDTTNKYNFGTNQVPMLLFFTTNQLGYYSLIGTVVVLYSLSRLYGIPCVLVFKSPFTSGHQVHSWICSLLLIRAFK